MSSIGLKQPSHPAPGSAPANARVLPKGEGSSIGLIIGRFQPFHVGHALLVEKSLEEHAATLLLIGSSNKDDSQNPWSFDTRKEIIEELYGEKKLFISALPDFPNDEDWVQHILLHVPSRVSKLTLYCGDIENDSAVIALIKLKDSLPFELYIKEIPRSIIAISATEIRSAIQEKNDSFLSKYLHTSTIESLKKI